MYKKIARIGPISFGIFYALLTLLAVIIVLLLGAFVLPIIPMGENIPQMDGIKAATEVIASGEGLSQMAMGLGMMLLMSFIIGLILAILYNIVAMITGGIKVKVEDLGYDDI